MYCNNHVPNPNPHDLPIFSKSNSYSHNTNFAYNISNILKDNKQDDNGIENNNKKSDAGLQDLRIAHAIKATQITKPYPKIKHEGAKYIVVS